MSLSPVEIADAMEASVALRQNLLVWGPPGIGKTAIAGQVAARMGYALVVVPVATMDAGDVRFPQIKDGRLTWLVSDWFPQPGCGPTIILVDEINRAQKQVQNGILGMCGPERRIGSNLLPDNVAILACANPADTSRGVESINDALMDRFNHVEIKPDATHQSWQVWGKANGMPMELIAYCRNRPRDFYSFVKGEQINVTYRSWERVGHVLKAGLAQNIERALIEGAVGAGPAVEVLGFVEGYRNLSAFFNLDAILMSPDTAPIPDADQHATRYAVADGISRRMTVANIGRAFRYLDRLPREFRTMAVQDAVDRDPVLTNTPEYTAYTVDNPAD